MTDIPNKDSNGDKRFLRSEIVLGAGGLARLRRSHAVIVGYGAVGSAAAEALARTGLGHIRIIDADVYDVTNINRQLGCDDRTVGRYKVDVGREHFSAISPEIDAEAVVAYVAAETIDIALRPFSDGCRPEIVIDAIDTIDAKVALLRACHEAGIAVLSSMGAARKTRPEAIRFSDISKTEVCPLAREVRKRLKKMGIAKGISCVYSVEAADAATHRPGDASPGAAVKRPQLGSLMTVTASFGLRLAAEAMRILIGGQDALCGANFPVPDQSQCHAEID